MKDIKNYEGLYAVTEDGRVWSYKSNKYLKPGNSGKGYLFVILCKDNKYQHTYIHRLVAEAYIPNPDNLPQVNHKDEVRSNNSRQNLEWCSGIYNTQYSQGKQVLCVELNKVFSSTWEATRQLKLRSNHICEVVNKDNKVCGGYHWRYV